VDAVKLVTTAIEPQDSYKVHQVSTLATKTTIQQLIRATRPRVTAMWPALSCNLSNIPICSITAC
jgi:hypothetical protein